MEKLKAHSKRWMGLILLILSLSTSALLFQNCGSQFVTKELASKTSGTSSNDPLGSGNNPAPAPTPNPAPAPLPAPLPPAPMPRPVPVPVPVPLPPPVPVPLPVPVPVPVPVPPPVPVPVPTPTPAATGFQIGQHFHRPVASVNHKYMFARTHDNEAVSEGLMRWWKGHDSYDFAALDKFRDFHKGNGAKILLTVYGTPRFASARPDEPNRPYPSWVGGLAEPKDLGSFGRMIQTTVNRYKNDLYAVECWNEPFADAYRGYDPANAEFFSGSPTALADMCKALYNAVKAANPTTPVICPAQAWHTPVVINAKTSQGESILRFCDYLGWHPYGYTGVAGFGGNLSQLIDQINGWQRDAGGPVRPIAITEWGVGYVGNVEQEYKALSSTQKANVLYQTLKVAYQKGIKAFGLYAYDSHFVGINGTDAVVGSGITKAVDEFGGK